MKISLLHTLDLQNLDNEEYRPNLNVIVEKFLW